MSEEHEVNTFRIQQQKLNFKSGTMHWASPEVVKDGRDKHQGGTAGSNTWAVETCREVSMERLPPLSPPGPACILRMLSALASLGMEDKEEMTEIGLCTFYT